MDGRYHEVCGGYNLRGVGDITMMEISPKRVRDITYVVLGMQSSWCGGYTWIGVIT